MEYVNLEKCSKNFDNQQVLKEISYSFFAGGYCISGENGSGKSTLLKMMMGLILPDTGCVTVIEEKSENSEETKKIDIGFVGEIENINTEIIKMLEKSDYIPVISSIGTDKNGQTYNINADYVAGEIAGKLNADRMIFLTDVDGILLDYHDKQTLIDEIDVYHVNKLIEKGIISGGMLPKVNTCLKAIEKGVENVVILNGKLEHSLLLELFTDEGAGTLIKK